MHNNPLFIALLVGMTGMSACQNDAPQQATPAVGETTQPIPAPQDQAAPAPMTPSAAPDNGGSATLPQMSPGRPAAPAAAPAGATAAGMNPPHGQPNHRCDISVGAPLDSKPVPKPQ